nr:MAG TPA: hypothetical protein [Bacteriophage sp.]
MSKIHKFCSGRSIFNNIRITMSNSKMLLPSTPISLLGITRLIKVIINTGSINTITT